MGAGSVGNLEFAERGVRLYALCPGRQHPLLKELFSMDPDRAAKGLVHIPMGHFGARGDRKAALFPRRRRFSFVTASSFLVDGGLSAAYLTPALTD